MEHQKHPVVSNAGQWIILAVISIFVAVAVDATIIPLLVSAFQHGRR